MPPSSLAKHVYDRAKTIFKEPISLIVLLALVVNLSFVCWGAELLLGENKYFGNDTFSWVDAFLNLLHTGHYTFDLDEPDAYFGRVPGFSFFWGIHYLIFGADYVYQAVAVTQSILGALSAYLIYAISLKLFHEKRAALLAALLYTFYPFALYWVSVSQAESISSFIQLLFFNVLLRDNKSTRHYVLLGILSALVFYAREFMGIILVVAFVFNAIDKTVPTIKQRVKNNLLVTLAFLAVYGIWPARNYINHHRIILGREYNGFPLFKDHFLSYTDWVHCWDTDEDKWVKKAILDHPVVFPEDIFSSPGEKEMAMQLVKRANECGTSFWAWQKIHTGIEPMHTKKTCNAEIEQGFNQLRHSFIAHHPVRYAFDVPAQNLKKAFFKNHIQEGSMIRNKQPVFQSVLFGYRTWLLFMALAGMLIAWNNRKVFPVFLVFIMVYGYLCFVYRYIEMRNFMQVDVLLLVPAAFCLYTCYQKVVAGKAA